MEGPSDLLKVIPTVWHLRPVQVADRIARRLRRLPANPTTLHRLRPRAPSPSCRTERRAAFSNGAFTFLRARRPFEGSDRWSPREAPLLWTYYLHYFQYLPFLPPREALPLVRDWLVQNPPPTRPAWEPYPLSLRIREWTEWLLAHPDLPEEEGRLLVASLVHQTEALRAQLEYHLQGNHLLENAITLCWSGLSLDGPQAAGWLGRGLALLERELASQVLGDGSHEERSPMYQALLAEALLRLNEIARQGAGEQATRVAALAGSAGGSLLKTLEALTHPDGEYALLNDTSLGDAPTLDDLLRRFGSAGERLPASPVGAWQLSSAGYFGIRDQGTSLVFDAGALGPDHQPGHGHADMLSFEMSHRGRRVIADTGAFTYDPGASRDWDRGTGAHNTVQVDERDQSDLWGAFRCGRRARVIEAALAGEGADVRLTGAYRGPGKRAGSIEHRRGLRRAGSVWSIRDQIRANGNHSAVLRLHLAPGIAVRRDAGSVAFADQEETLGRLNGAAFAWQETRSPYHPSFGLELERPCLVARFSFRDRLDLSWALELL